MSDMQSWEEQRRAALEAIDQEKAERWADERIAAWGPDDGPVPAREDFITYWHEQHAEMERRLEEERQKTPAERFMGGPEGPAGAMGYQGPWPPNYGSW